MRRWLIWGTAAVVIPSVALILVVHLPAVQRRAFDRGVAALARSTGLHLSAADVGLRLWPARFEATDLELRQADRRIASLGSVRVAWRWTALLGSPARVDSLEVSGFEVDVREPPDLPEPSTRPDAGVVDPWRVVEVGRLEIEGGTMLAAAGGIVVEARGVKLAGALEDGQALLRLDALEIEAEREARRLKVGPLELQARGSATGIDVERCRLGGEAAKLEVTGNLIPGETGLAARGDFLLAAETAPLVHWWDPDLASLLAPRGRVRFEGAASMEPDGALEIEVEHRGDPFEIAGYDVRRVRLTSTAKGGRLELAGDGWGEAVASKVNDGDLQVALHLERAPLGPAFALLPEPGPASLPKHPEISGEVVATLALPFEVERLQGRVDLEVGSSDLEARLLGRIADGTLDADRLQVTVPGGSIFAEGTVRFDGEVDARLKAVVNDPATLAGTVAPFLPVPMPVAVGGGPLRIEAVLAGSVGMPDIDVDLAWQSPEVGGRRVARVTASAQGTADRIEWQLEVVPVPGSLVAASGTAEPLTRSIAGEWSAAVPDLSTAAGLVPAAADLPLSGSVSGTGGFQLGGTMWSATGVLEGRGLAWAEWSAEDIRIEFEADPESVRVSTLEVEFAGARIKAAGRAGLSGIDAPVAARLDIEGLDPAALPLELPSLPVGTASTVLNLSGTVAAPEADLVVEWVPGDLEGPVGPVRVRAAATGGVVRCITERLDTAAGSVAVEATVPLGGLDRPPWLWPDAPSGPVEARVRALGLRSTPLMTAMGIGNVAASLSTDLALDLRWDLGDPSRRRVELVLENLAIETSGESIKAESPVMAWMDGRQFRVAPVVLTGQRSRLEVDAGAVDLETREIYAHADVTLDPSVVRLLPVPLQASGPLGLTAELSGLLDSPNGAVTLDHRGGRLVLRDPPVEVTDLTFHASLDGGVLTVDFGGAQVNRGRLEFGGGWDPATGQGLVLQLENVAFVVAGGMVTRWSGVLAVEPEPGRLARVVGELVLDGGVWEQSVDLAGSFLSPNTTPVAADDPTHDILLDLQVRGRGGIHVDNNLGRFDVGWGVLQVRGTAAQPVLEGEVRIAAGGEIALTGKAVEVQRGVIEFTGEAGTEPRIELIPKDDLFGGTGERLDAEMVARRGLASGLGKVLGLENETLRPAEIAVETETDPGTRFSVGQRISRQIALFFSTDLADPQDQVTTLQLWNLRFLRGLALQAFNESAGQDGFAAVERLSWGGSAATVDRPVIQSVKLEGDWPMSKRRMRRASGLSRGDPFEDIFLFVGEVRMEHALTEAGYFEARVDGRAEGSERLPKLVFTCQPGPRQVFEFTGDGLEKAARREAIALYQPPPLESGALEAIRQTLARRLAIEGFPEAEVTVDRREDRVVVDVRRGKRVELKGPIVDGVPADIAADLVLAYGGPAQLADLLNNPGTGSAWVERLVAARGYDQARLVRVWSEPISGNEVRVHLQVDLGPRSVVDEIVFEGSDPLGVTSSPEFGLIEGMPLDRGTIDTAVSRLRRRYRDEGYFDVEARWRTAKPEPGRRIVKLRLTPGSRRTVDSVTLTGLRHLSENLLRRNLSLREGDLLSAAEIDSSVSRLVSFAPVERVTASTHRLQGGRTEVRFAVAEKPRWTVGLGARWGTDSGSEVLFDVRDENLFHRGFSANLRGHVGGDRQYYSIVTSLPPPPGRRLSLGLALTYTDEFVGSFVQEMRSRATFDATYSISRQSTVRSYLGIRRTRTIDDSQFIPQDATTDFVILGGQVALDRLDDPFDPRSGFMVTADLSWNTEISDLNRDFLRSLVGGALVIEPRSRWIWSQALKVGTSEPLNGAVLPSGRDARFFAGGQASLRGFPLDGVGPTDFFTGGPVGGGAIITVREDLQIPLWKTLRLAVFADVGNVWERWDAVDWGEVVVGAGLGFRVGTPIGPVYVEAGWPVVDPAEQGGSTQYYFGVGRRF